MPATPTCLCGHDANLHPDGPCAEPTQRCQCPQYEELCPVCRHPKATHDGPNNICGRIKRDTRQPCGCVQYPPTTGE